MDILAPFGFSPSGVAAKPWLPQPASWSAFTAEAQAAVPGSMLSLYREGLRIRSSEPALGDGSLRWLEAPAGVLAFTRRDEFACVLNLSEFPVDLPPYHSVLLRSGPLDDGLLPQDTAAWIRLVAGISHESASDG